MPLQRSQRPSPELNENDPADKPGRARLVARGEEFAHRVEHSQVHDGAGTRRLGQRRLIHHDHGAEFICPGDLVATARRLVAGLAVQAEEILVEHIVNERALAAAADAR